MATVSSVNLGRSEPNPYKAEVPTGFGKRPVAGPVAIRDPGPKAAGAGSGLVGDVIGDRRSHGGSDQAVYAFAREDLDAWERRLGRELPNGSFGENLTTVGIDVNAALVGERWRIGDTVILQVTEPRIPCATFRGRMGVPGWLKMFASDGRPGTYLRVVTPGSLAGGDRIQVVHRPTHEVTVSLLFRALTSQPELYDDVLLAGDDLAEETRRLALARQTFSLG